MPVEVERVDFVSFLTQDIARARRFYAETLGLTIESEGEHDIEFCAGQVTLDIFDPASIGHGFAPSPAGLALRVPDVAAARSEWNRRASSSTARPSTQAYATWLPFATRTGTP